MAMSYKAMVTWEKSTGEITTAPARVKVLKHNLKIKRDDDFGSEYSVPLSHLDIPQILRYPTQLEVGFAEDIHAKVAKIRMAGSADDINAVFKLLSALDSGKQRDKWKRPEEEELLKWKTSIDILPAGPSPFSHADLFYTEVYFTSLAGSEELSRNSLIRIKQMCTHVTKRFFPEAYESGRPIGERLVAYVNKKRSSSISKKKVSDGGEGTRGDEQHLLQLNTEVTNLQLNSTHTLLYNPYEDEIQRAVDGILGDEDFESMGDFNLEQLDTDGFSNLEPFVNYLENDEVSMEDLENDLSPSADSLLGAQMQPLSAAVGDTLRFLGDDMTGFDDYQMPLNSPAEQYMDYYTQPPQGFFDFPPQEVTAPPPSRVSTPEAISPIKPVPKRKVRPVPPPLPKTLLRRTPKIKPLDSTKGQPRTISPFRKRHNTDTELSGEPQQLGETPLAKRRMSLPGGVRLSDETGSMTELQKLPQAVQDFVPTEALPEEISLASPVGAVAEAPLNPTAGTAGETTNESMETGLPADNEVPLGVGEEPATESIDWDGLLLNKLSHKVVLQARAEKIKTRIDIAIDNTFSMLVACENRDKVAEQVAEKLDPQFRASLDEKGIRDWPVEGGLARIWKAMFRAYDCCFVHRPQLPKSCLADCPVELVDSKAIEAHVLEDAHLRRLRWLSTNHKFMEKIKNKFCESARQIEDATKLAAQMTFPTSEDANKLIDKYQISIQTWLRIFLEKGSSGPEKSLAVKVLPKEDEMGDDDGSMNGTMVVGDGAENKEEGGGEHIDDN